MQIDSHAIPPSQCQNTCEVCVGGGAAETPAEAGRSGTRTPEPAWGCRNPGGSCAEWPPALPLLCAASARVPAAPWGFRGPGGCFKRLLLWFPLPPECTMGVPVSTSHGFCQGFSIPMCTLWGGAWWLLQAAQRQGIRVGLWDLGRSHGVVGGGVLVSHDFMQWVS